VLGTIYVTENSSNEEAAITLIHEYTHSQGGNEVAALSAHMAAAAEIFKNADPWDVLQNYARHMDANGYVPSGRAEQAMTAARANESSIYASGWNTFITPIGEEGVWHWWQ
jgi:urocanate hydratase